MSECKGCNGHLPFGHVARYDVLAPAAEVTPPGELGPYCEGCFADTETGRQIASRDT